MDFLSVVIFLMDGSIIRPFMIAAQSLGFTNGDYAFFALDLFRDDTLSTDGWKKGQSTGQSEWFDGGCVAELFCLSRRHF